MKTADGEMAQKVWNFTKYPHSKLTLKQPIGRRRLTVERVSNGYAYTLFRKSWGRKDLNPQRREA